MTGAADFMCPRCTSRYKLVRVRANPEFPSGLIQCRVCKEPFAPTDGEYVLKYFLVDKAKKHNGVDLRMNHAPKGGRPRLAPSSLAGRSVAVCRASTLRDRPPTGVRDTIPASSGLAGFFRDRQQQ